MRAAWLIMGATALALWWYLTRSSAAPADSTALRATSATVPPASTVASDAEPVPAAAIGAAVGQPLTGWIFGPKGWQPPPVPLGEAMPGYFPGVLA